MSGILRVYVTWKTLWEADIQPQPRNVYYSLCKSPLLRACTARQDQSRHGLTLAHFGRCARSCAAAAGLHWTWAVLSSHEWMKYRNANRKCYFTIEVQSVLFSCHQREADIVCKTWMWNLSVTNPSQIEVSNPAIKVKLQSPRQLWGELDLVHIKLTIFCTTWKTIWW